MSKKLINFLPTKAEEEAAAAAGSSSGQAAAAAAEANRWKIVKTLTSSDVDKTKMKLVLPKGGPGGVEENILCYLDEDMKDKALAGEQQVIKMKDVDTREIISNMTISKEQKAKQFYIKGHWMKGFVQRRGLQVGDPIGLRWNVAEHCLEFSKLDYV